MSTRYTFSSWKNNLTVTHAERGRVWFDLGSEVLRACRILDCTGGVPDSLQTDLSKHRLWCLACLGFAN